MISIYKKELTYFFNNPIGYIFVLVFAGLVNFFSIKDMYIESSYSLNSFFSIIPWALIVFISLVTMRTIAEEKRGNTIELLLTIPLSEFNIILGKYFANLSVIVIGLILTLPLPFFLAIQSNLYLPQTMVGYLGVILLASFFTALGTFVSCTTKSQVIAGVISAPLFLIIYLSGSDVIKPYVPTFIFDIFSIFTPSSYYESIIRGIIDIRSLVYFVSMSSIALLLAVIDLEKRS